MRELKRELLRFQIAAAAAKNPMVDSEDIDVIVQYRLGEISSDQMNSFFLAKATLLESQRLHPH